MEYSTRLIEERERLGYTAEEVAAIGGVGRATQYNYEKGFRKPDLAYLRRLHEVGFDIYYLVTGEELGLANTLIYEERELITYYRKATNTLRQIAKHVLMMDLKAGGDSNEDQTK